MIFYVIVTTFLMTLLMNKFTCIVTGDEIWMKFTAITEIKSGIFCILTIL